MVGTIHPTMVQHFREWKTVLDEAGVSSDSTGMMVLDQIIGFCLHAYLYNNPNTGRDEALARIGRLFDEVKLLFEMRGRPTQ